MHHMHNSLEFERGGGGGVLPLLYWGRGSVHNVVLGLESLDNIGDEK